MTAAGDMNSCKEKVEETFKIIKRLIASVVPPHLKRVENDFTILTGDFPNERAVSFDEAPQLIFLVFGEAHALFAIAHGQNVFGDVKAVIVRAFEVDGYALALPLGKVNVSERDGYIFGDKF